jgi:hypothetical protein
MQLLLSPDGIALTDGNWAYYLAPPGNPPGRPGVIFWPSSIIERLTSSAPMAQAGGKSSPGRPNIDKFLQKIKQLGSSMDNIPLGKNGEIEL